MPNRVIRECLLESDRWLELHDNAARVCYVACLLTADDVGNMEGSNPRLRRLWREYGIDSDAKVASVLQLLIDHDLLRVYDADGKRHLHIPRFKQFLRYVKRRVLGSPWDDSEKIQQVAEKKRREHNAEAAPENGQSTVKASLSRPEVKRSEVKRREEKLNRSESESESNRSVGSLIPQELKQRSDETLEQYKSRLISFSTSTPESES